MAEKDINWENDMFTKMVKEYGKKINLISERVEKELMDMLNNCEEIDLFKKDLDKKKVK